MSFVCVCLFVRPRVLLVSRVLGFLLVLSPSAARLCPFPFGCSRLYILPLGLCWSAACSVGAKIKCALGAVAPPRKMLFLYNWFCRALLRRSNYTKKGAILRNPRTWRMPRGWKSENEVIYELRFPADGTALSKSSLLLESAYPAGSPPCGSHGSAVPFCYNQRGVAPKYKGCEYPQTLPQAERSKALSETCRYKIE